MCRVAGKLAQPFDALRVDMFYCQGKAYVGELTNCHGAARETFSPREIDALVRRLLSDPASALGNI